MCGINGFTFRDSELLRRMHRTTHHRGPDDEGFFEDAKVSLAHNRLAIIDLTPTGHQPMHSPDGRYTIVFNGEIYNYQALRKDLEAQGERFTGQSDTEVLLAVFARWGEEGLRKLRGMFAFAVWDREEERLYLVRDAVGVKPLYYRIEGERLWFSSELQPLLRVGSGFPELDEDSLDIYLRLLYVPGPYTMMKGIRKLPAGSQLMWHQGQATITSWYIWSEGVPFSSYNEAMQSVQEGVSRAVQRQLVSDRPVGLFLSGGMDSSIVLAAMRRARDESRPIRTYTVRYTSPEEETKYNTDADLARKTAQFFGTQHTEVLVTPEDVLSCIDRVAAHMDEPIANHVLPATFLLSQVAVKDVTVVLGGDGGDELFGGYPRYWYHLWIERARALGGGGLGSLLAVAGARGDVGRLARMLTMPMCADRHLAFLLQRETQLAKLRPHADSGRSLSRLKMVFDPLFVPHWKDVINQSMAADVRTWLCDESFVRTDRMTMAHGLEARVPFLDEDLLSLAFSIPSRWKVGTRKEGKRILREAWKSHLPPHLFGQEKRAFMSPAAKWIRGPLLPFMESVLSASYCSRSEMLFDFSSLQALLRDHVEKRSYELNVLWALATFQVWYRQLWERHGGM